MLAYFSCLGGMGCSAGGCISADRAEVTGDRELASAQPTSCDREGNCSEAAASLDSLPGDHGVGRVSGSPLAASTAPLESLPSDRGLSSVSGPPLASTTPPASTEFAELMLEDSSEGLACEAPLGARVSPVGGRAGATGPLREPFTTDRTISTLRPRPGSLRIKASTTRSAMPFLICSKGSSSSPSSVSALPVAAAKACCTTQAQALSMQFNTASRASSSCCWSLTCAISLSSCAACCSDSCHASSACRKSSHSSSFCSSLRDSSRSELSSSSSSSSSARLCSATSRAHRSSDSRRRASSRRTSSRCASSIASSDRSSACSFSKSSRSDLASASSRSSSPPSCACCQAMKRADCSLRCSVSARLAESPAWQPLVTG
mmetsp:Transcript_106344/g.282961  ORF Transcript_106344/g.282961 Transcript_106344/m.282961 type:complete len:376 (+) Transcript_106344:779-1906(+)